jgi:hypothetical protein
MIFWKCSAARPVPIAISIMRPRGVHVRRDLGEHQHLGAECVGDRHEIGRTLAAQGGDRLLDLERVAARAAQRAVHRCEQRDDGTAAIGPELDHRHRQLELALQVGKKGARAALHVEHEPRQPSASFLLMMLAAMSGIDSTVHRRVAQGVHLLVGGRDLVGLSDERAPDLDELLAGLRERERRLEARDRLELVERAAGVPEARVPTSSAPRRRGTR